MSIYKNTTQITILSSLFEVLYNHLNNSDKIKQKKIKIIL